MFKQIFTAAVISTALIAVSTAPTLASQEESSESSFWADRAKAKAKITNPDGTSKTISTVGNNEDRKIVTRDANDNVTKVERKPKTEKSSITSRMSDGSSRTITDNGDGTRTITERAPGGAITSERTIGQAPDHAINHTDGVVSVGIGNGTHLIVGPGGISFSN